MECDENYVILAVNGTLMRGLALEVNMISAGATFHCEAKTESTYRLWSIHDIHPAMIRTSPIHPNATSVDVELWKVPTSGLAEILLQEPAGLSIGKVKLDSGETVLGVIAEPELVLDMKEISHLGGWRAYINR